MADSGPNAWRGRGPAELALARVERAAGEHAAAEDTAYRALATLAASGARLGIVEALELIAGLAQAITVRRLELESEPKSHPVSIEIG